MVDKNRIMDILKKHPHGLKAKDIAACIYGADRKSINQILYANPALFSCNSNYEWTVASTHNSTHNFTTKSVPSITYQLTTKTNQSVVDKEVFKDYRNYYVEVKQGSLLSENTTLELYLLGDNNYIVQSTSKKIQCPFCNNIVSVRSYDCDKCGHSMHDICENLYNKWNISGHRFYITWRPVDEYPINERKREVYNSVRKFIKNSLHHSVHTYFKDVIDEIHIDTLAMIYQKSLGLDRVEEEIKEEVYSKACELREKLSSDERSDTELRKQASYYLDKAYNNDVLVNYEACKLYLAYMTLLGRTTSMKYTKNMVTLKIYGGLDLSSDTIYQAIRLSNRDTIVSTEYLRTYHKECDHYCEKVYLKIPLMLSNGDIIIRTLLGTYCDRCKKYFILDTEFKKILCEGKIQVQISFFESESQFNGMDLSPESLLRKCGYTVNASSKATKEQRQKLLKAIIENKLYTPAKIVTHFRFLVSMNKNVTSRDMCAAISKWQEDIMFLQQNYS